MDYRKNFSFSTLLLSTCLLLTSVWIKSSVAAEVEVKFVGCYEDNVGDSSFYILPSDADPTKMTVEDCVEKCTHLSTMMEITAAGIQSGSSCLCAKNTGKAEKLDVKYCSEKCTNTKHKDTTCGSGSDLAITSVYEVISTFGLVKVTKFDRTGKSTKTEFTVDPKPKGVVHIFDYGDDAPTITVKDGNIPAHAYPLPGTYRASVVATPAIGIGNQADMAFRSFSVDQPFEEASLDISNCTNETIPATPYTCTVKILSGTNALLGIIFTRKLVPDDVKKLKENLEAKPGESDLKKDISVDLTGSNLVSIFNEVDIESFAVGPVIPQSDSPGFIKTGSSGSFVMYESAVIQSGYITAVQVYGDKKGAIEIWVLKPQTLANSTHCFYEDKCDNLIFYPYCKSNRRSSDKYDKRSQVKAVTKIETGYQIFSLKKEDYVEVTEGDILAFTAKDGTLAYRDATPDEIPDFSASDKDFSASDKENRRKRATRTDKRHFLTAIVTSPKEVEIQHEFGTSGNYTMLAALLSLSAVYTDRKVYKEQDIYAGIALEGIIKLDKCTKVHKQGWTPPINTLCKLNYRPLETRPQMQIEFFRPTGRQLSLHRVLMEFKIELQKDYYKTEEDVEFKGIFTNGTDATIDWNFGDGKKGTTVHLGDLTKLASISTTHAYKEDDNYTVKALAKNVKNNFESNEVTVAVYAPINSEDWNITGSTAALSPPGKLNFTVEYIGKRKKRPQGISVEITWQDDGEKETFKIDDDSSAKEFTYEHSFPLGNHTASIRLFNPVSSISITRKVEIIEEIKDGEPSVLFSEKADSPVFRKGYGDKRNSFPKDAFLNITYKPNKGQVDKYVIEWENGTKLYDSSELPNIQLQFKEEGNYTIRILTSNKLQDRDPIIVSWQISAMLRDINVDDFEKVTDLDQEHVYQVDVAGVDFCLHVDFGDGNMQKYGDETLCKNESFFPKSDYNSTKLDHPQNFTHVYVNRGYYDFVATAITDVNQVKKKLSITVNKSKFDRHKVAFRVNATDFRNPIKTLKSTGYRIETQAYLHAGMNITDTKMVWAITPIDPETGEETHPTLNLVNETFGASWNKSFLFMNPRILNYGLYKATYHFHVTSDVMDANFPVNSTCFSYYEILKTELAAVIVEDDLYKIMRGYGQNITLEPDRYSSDLDLDKNAEKGFTIKWFCSRIDLLEKIESYNISEEQSQKIPPPTGNHTNEDKGGCFGNGPGRVAVGSKTWNLDAKSLYKPNATYRVEVEISKDDRVSNASLLIRLDDEPAPVLQVKCLNGLLCALTTDGTFINPTIRLAAYAKCLDECPTSNYTYQWKVSGTNDEDSLTSTDLDVDPYIIGQGESMMALSIDFFKRYSEYKVLSLSMEIIERNETAGQVTNRLIVNQPPVNGTCSITERGTKALVTEYEVTCRDWMDPEGHEVANYKIFLVDERNFTSTLVSSLDTQFRVILRPGTLNLWSEVSDIYGASTKQIIEEAVNVPPPTQAEYEEFMKNKLRLLRLAGNQFQLMQALQAIQTIQYYYPNLEGAPPPPEPGSEKEKQAEVKISENINTFMGYLKDCNLNSMDDIDFVSNTAGTIIGKGDHLDRTGKDLGLNMADKLTDMLIKPDFETIVMITPLQSKGFLTNTMSIVGAVAGGISKTILQNHILPSDMKHVNDIEYDTAIDPDPNFAIPDSLEGMQVRSIKEDAIAQSKTQFNTITELVNNINTLVLENLIPLEPPLHLKTISGVDMSIIRSKPAEAANISFPVGGAAFKLPTYCELTNQEPNCTETAPFSLSVVTWKGPIFPASKNIDVLSSNTKIVQIDVFTGNLNENSPLSVSNASRDIEIEIPRNPQELPNVTVVEPNMKWFEYMVYHQVQVPSHDSSINLQFSIDSEATYAIFMRYQRKPVVDQFDKIWIVTPDNMTNGTFEQFLTSNDINNQTGYFYFGVTELFDQQDDATYQNITKAMVNKNFTTSYSMRLFTASCLYYSESIRLWVSHGCSVVTATQLSTKCKCNHLTSFGSGFFVAPNPIDFSYVFANASFADNLTIYVTIIVTFSLFIIFLIWARCKDRKDVEKLGALPLPDNNANDKYMYEILVFTGNAKGATTNSKVNFILSGDKDETEIRTFGTPPRKVFRREGVDVFVMSVPRPLGQLQFVRIWHDNNGKGNFASWYLNYIMFRDVQTGEKFEFVCNNWFALEKGDGQIDRVLPVADKAQLTEFGHLFQTTSRKKLTDGHLWFSVFLRPPRSRFTRCQRVASCMSLLYLSMLVNAMWYGTVPEKPQSGMNFGPVHLSPDQLAVGFMSNIIVFPPSFFIIFLFRKARPRKLRPSRIDQALEVQRNKTGAPTPKKERPSSTREGKSTDAIKYNRPKKFTLPWWCAIIAWILCFICMGASIFFLWAYGITFGNTKTKSWITSLIISFFSSILITQPIKVLLLAMIFSAICKKVETDEDDADEDELDPQLDFDEQWLNNDPTKPRKVAYKQTQDPEEVEKARNFRIKEVKTWGILTEIFAYIVFLWILGIIGYGNNDPNAFWMVRTLKTGLLKEGKLDGYLNIKNPQDFWRWTNKVLMYNLRAHRDYTGTPPFGLAGFLNDRVNRLMGYAIMRQIRLPPGQCTKPAMVRNLTKCSGTTTEIVREDHNDYDVGWNVLLKNASNFLAEYQVVEKAFRYRTQESLDGFPFVGDLDVYSGGGYVFELTGRTDELLKKLKRLRRTNWIDRLTRAVMIDFSVYNAQVNLFGVVKLFCEFFPGGGVVPEWAIDSIRLIEYEGSSWQFIALCQGLFILFILYYLIRELRQMCKKGRQYFRELGNYAELALIGFSITAMVVFVIRYYAAQTATDTFRETKGNLYINLTRCQVLSSVLNWVMALIVFVSGVKFVKLLRFNKRLRMLSQTILQCAIDLKGFALVFFIICFAYGQVFLLHFQPYLRDYSTMVHTMESLFAALLNVFTFDDYKNGGGSQGPFIFLSFSVITSIVLINLFLTIIIQTFEQVKLDLADQPNQYEVADYVIRRIKGVFGFGGRQPQINVQNAEAKATELEKNHPTNRFPEKVDQLLEYINVSYFDGKLDFNSKEALRHGRRKQNYNPRGDAAYDRPNVYNSN